MAVSRKGLEAALICDFSAPSLLTKMAFGGFESRRGHHFFSMT